MNQSEQLFKDYSRMDDLLTLISHLPNSRLYRKTALMLSTAMTRLTVSGVNVTVAGEFNRGKSTLVNALAGQEITPESPLPMTRCDIHICGSSNERYSLDFGEGMTEVSRDVFNAALCMRDNAIHSACAEYPDFAPGTQIELIDTYGLNDGDEESLESIFRSDILVWLLVPDSPFSQSESAVLKQWLDRPHGKLLLAVNKVDQLEGDLNSVNQLISAIRNRLRAQLIDVEATPIFPISAKAARIAQKKGESAQESGVPALWNAVLMSAHDAALAHRISCYEADLKSCVAELNTLMDTQRCAMADALRTMDAAKPRLTELLSNMALDMSKTYQEAFSYETCACPVSAQQRMQEEMKNVVAVVPTGVRYAKDAATRIANVGRSTLGQINDGTGRANRAARERFIDAINALMLDAMSTMNALVEPVNEAVKRVYEGVDAIQPNFGTALASKHLSMETNMPRLNMKLDEIQLIAAMVMGKNSVTQRLSSDVDNAFAVWRVNWEATLKNRVEVLNQWRDSLIASASETLEEALEPVRMRIQSDLETLTDIDLNDVLSKPERHFNFE